MSETIIQAMIEVKLKEPDDFLKVRETLTRIGIASRKEKTLFALDGKTSNFSENDEARRNTVANLLSEWELISLVEPEKSAEPTVPLSQLKILSFKEKDEWELTPKYNIGNKKEVDVENDK
jgi:hypothetical protein